MAAGKKSFIIYTSWKIWLDGLTLEQKGKWLEWMIDYCNDLVPDYPTDQAVKIACMMAQDTLKRDLKKYEERVERIKTARTQNPNNNKEIEITKKDTEIKLKSNNNQSDISSVNVNDNDNVNVNVNDNEISKDIVNNSVSFNKETTPEATKDTPPVVIALPCLKGYNHPIYEDDIKHYQELYPAVNVHQELKIMLGWLESNPNNRKTKNGIKAFITRWLSKKQDKAPRTKLNKPTGYYEDELPNGGFRELGEDGNCTF